MDLLKKTSRLERNMKEGETKNQTVAEVTEELKDPPLTGAANILLEKKVAWKIIRIIIIILFMSLFTYKLCEFLTEYFKYTTVETSKFLGSMYANESILFVVPGLVICNKNPAPRQEYCVKHPFKCEIPDNNEEFCYKYPHYCQNSKLPEGFRISTHSSFLPETLLEFQQKAKDFFDFEQEHVIRSRKTAEDLYFFLIWGGSALPCYTKNYCLLDKYPYVTDAEKRVKGKQLPLFHLKLLFDINNTANWRIEPGAILGVGSPFEPFIPNIVIRPERKYIIKLQMVEERRLPLPYDTECRNYYAEWLKNNRSGPLSRKMCIFSCLQKKIENQRCKSCYWLAFYEDGTFPVKQLCHGRCYIHPLYEHKKECSTICKEPCLKYRYTYLVEETEVHYWEEKRAEVFLELQDPPVKIVSYKPRHEPFELFSRIGGYIGLWLGLCVIALFDFVISFVYSLSVAVKNVALRCVSRIRKMCTGRRIANFMSRKLRKHVDITKVDC
ncbi:uncharacterized protein LOC118205441 [Stegodyphus dumicola]|uniref:uncharacterized protein LOC118205441 n=1 Tax=Stegodyphus dumicola TaxID=202533 RepID=UPI0015AA9727|nr:uncharacterized protein LOC118205441 [Stegodyphus dumicola]